MYTIVDVYLLFPQDGGTRESTDSVGTQASGSRQSTGVLCALLPRTGEDIPAEPLSDTAQSLPQTSRQVSAISTMRAYACGLDVHVHMSFLCT